MEEEQLCGVKMRAKNNHTIDEIYAGICDSIHQNLALISEYEDCIKEGFIDITCFKRYQGSIYSKVYVRISHHLDEYLAEISFGVFDGNLRYSKLLKDKIEEVLIGYGFKIYDYIPITW